MAIITLITSIDLDPELQMSLVKTAVTEGYDATLLQMLTKLQDAQTRVQQTEAEVEAERSQKDTLQAKVEEANATIHRQATLLEEAKTYEADLSYEELEDRLRIVQAMLNRETRQHALMKRELVATKQLLTIYKDKE